MLSLRIGVAPSLAITAMLLAALVFPARPAAQVQTNSPAGNLPTTRLKVNSNLVVVRVVVRDAQGKPVNGLQKEDFKLFDSGKEQPIVQFEAESAVEPPSSPAATQGLAQAGATLSAGLPGRFLALYFDDLYTSDTDMIQVRKAADDYLAANLQPADRVAIFTSGAMLSDFTSDPKQIHEALSRLRAGSRAPALGHDCPDLTDYQALEMTRTQGKVDLENPWNTGDAWGLAFEEMSKRDCLPTLDRDFQAMLPQARLVAKNFLLARASTIVGQTEILAQSNLRELEEVVKYTAQMPGQRTVILGSPGFLLQDDNQFQLERIIDQALRLQVVISSLDPRGLAVVARQVDASQIYIPGSSGTSSGAMHRLDQNREVVATDVLAQVAEGTGGEFFHNSNDLKAGFGLLTGSPGSYILAFDPRDLKPDGKFHRLKVTLAEKHTTYSVQARRGYFALGNEAEAKAGAKEAEASSGADQGQEQIREALLSKTDIAQFPVALDAKVSAGQGETHELSLFSQVDPKSLHLQKESNRNLNTLTFVFGVFDQKDNLLTAHQRHATVDVADGELPAFLKAGISLGMDFQLKPGSYRIREVVTDSEHRLTALSRNVDIPKIIPVTAAASAPPPHPPQAPAPQPSGQPNPHLAQPSQTSSQATQPSLNQARIRDQETRLYSEAQPYLDGSAPELEKRVRELKGLKPDSSQEQLSDLLLKIGARVDELVAKVPDLTSDERVTQTQWVVGLAQDCASHSRVPGNFPIENCSQTSGKRIQKDFHYSIVSRQTQDGRVLDEFRTNEQNQPLKSGAEGPSFQGFVGSWVIFSPSNRSESRFHYLGEQKVGKREAFVIGFAQIPGSVRVPVMLVNGGRFVPILFQGVAWVDKEDFRIIQLRTDILAPQQDAGLQRETAKILFGPVDISRLNLELWLPMGVDVNVEADGLAVEEQHVYSKYRLYHATSKILP